jgi:ribosomal protein S18 acetylase RimI-like enzyme
VSLVVRRLMKEDAAAYREIRLEGLEHEPAAFGSTFEQEIERPLEDSIPKLEANFTFGVFEGNRLCGIATYHVETLLKTKHRGHVVGVYVRPAARGTGAAEALMRALIASARQQVLQLHLVVTQRNERARRFYERLGFQIYGSDPRGLRVGDEFYDDYLMVLRLDEGSTESSNDA